MKGVILAGGFGTRLHPLTKVLNKHLLPVYDRPMIFHAVECLARAGLEQVLIVTGGNQADQFAPLLGDGTEFGTRLEYVNQERAGGIAYALGLAAEFVDGDDLCLLLADNLFELTIRGAAERFAQQGGGARVLLAPVEHPEHYGIARLDGDRLVEIVEKPTAPPSQLAVTGCYFYDDRVFEIVQALRPSGRGELEITDVNNAYLARGALRWEQIDGYWTDCGESIDALLAAQHIVHARGVNKPLE